VKSKRDVSPVSTGNGRLSVTTSNAEPGEPQCFAWPRDLEVGGRRRKVGCASKAILRERIAATLDDRDEATIDDEIRDLFTALGR
jgi:hypothetical protein